MDYLGEELGLEDKRGQVIKVTRSPEELFSKATIASFEGKPTTNDHPAKNLDLTSVNYASKGHITNVRQAGDFLVADLFIVDAGLIADVKNGKREVSCGYDCMWVPSMDGNSYEQRTIVGNHVAVVQAGRAGSRVAIKDARTVERGVIRMPKKMSKSFLAALGFKQFAQDADPEDVAKAMDALGEKNDDGEEVKDANGTEEVMDAIGALGDTIKSVMDRVAGLEATIANGAKRHRVEDAKSVLDALEKDEVQDADESEKEEAQDEFPDKDEARDGCGVVPAQDSLAKFVQDMKPIIMAIPDEAARLQAAKKFAKSVKDARSAGAGVNGYGNIIGAVNSVKLAAMDQSVVRQSRVDATATAAAAWNNMNAQKGGN
jgi:hypothetical protein